MRNLSTSSFAVNTTISKLIGTLAIASYALLLGGGCQSGGGTSLDDGTGAAVGSGGAGDGVGGAGGTATGVTNVAVMVRPADNPCQIANPGIAVPAGTVATADISLPNQAADKAIDGDATTQWNSGAFTGWIQLTFPQAMMITGIRIAADALPITNETYTLTKGADTAPVAVATHTVWLRPGSLLPDIPIPPGEYASITISVAPGESWVGVNEITLLTSICP